MATKILVIDDHPDTMQLIELSLQRQGYEVLAAKNGREGIAKAKAVRPHLILLDIMMPDMDGYEVCRAIRAYEPLADIPIIMFTAKSDPAEKLAGFDAGADDFLTKPTRAGELAERVQLLLNRDGKKLATRLVDKPVRAIAILGARGGVGATTTAINLAASLALADEETILADLDLVQGHIAGYLDRPVQHNFGELFATESAEWPVSLDDYLIDWLDHARLLLTQSYLHLAPPLTAAHLNAFLDRVSESDAITIIDLGAQFGPEVVPVLRRADQLVLCLRPERAAVDAARRLLPYLREQRPVEETLHALMLDFRSGTQLPRKAVEKYIQQPLLDMLPIYGDDLAQAVNAGRAMVEMHPHAPLSHRFQALAHRLKTVESWVI